MQFADLHIHSNYSDGLLSPKQIIDIAIENGVSCISITDHDTIASQYELDNTYDNLEIISGIEFSTEFEDMEIHILGYYLDIYNNDLIRAIENIQTNRYKRALKIISKLNQIGINISIDDLKNENSLITSYGRGNIASAIYKKGYARSYKEAFLKYLDKGKIAYIKGQKLNYKEVLKLINNSGGISVLAHPGKIYRKMSIEKIIKEFKYYGLDGIEVYHPSHDKNQKSYLYNLAVKHKLIITGGSDFHSNINSKLTIGVCGIDSKHIYKIKKIKHNRTGGQKMEYSKKAKNINPSITLAITAKAKELKASGVDVVSFGAGEPDFNTPQNIIDAAMKAMQEGKTKYTAASGIPELKEALCKKFKQDNGLSYNKSNIVISTGGKQALANVMLAILNKGDEVLIPVPYWVSYPELVKLADGVPVFVECKPENDYKFTNEALEKAVTSKTKAIVINSPNNLSGSIYSLEELKMIAEFAKKHDILIISDEMYEKLIYDGEKHISIASLSEDAFNRTIVVNGFSKAFAMTGWRLGYSAANEEITKLMSSIQSHMTSNANSITQYAGLEALNGPKDELNNMVKEFEARRNYMTELIDSIEGLSYIRPAGAFYVMINIQKYLNKEVDGEIIKDSLDFSRLLLEKQNVAVIPGAAFGLDNYIRLSYATSRELIKKGLDRIKDFVYNIK